MLTSSEVSDRNRQSSEGGPRARIDWLANRSRQYKELSVSKNRQAEPFRLFVRRKGEEKYWRAMEFQSPSYLCERGDEYKRLGMIEHYYVSNVKEPF